MKKKILITLGIYSLVFLICGVYITTTIESSTSKLNALVQLHQAETQRNLLLINLENVQLDLNLRRTPRAQSVAATIANVQALEDYSHLCVICHHAEDIVKRLRILDKGIEQYKNLLTRVLVSGGRLL